MTLKLWVHIDGLRFGEWRFSGMDPPPDPPSPPSSTGYAFYAHYKSGGCQLKSKGPLPTLLLLGAGCPTLYISRESGPFPPTPPPPLLYSFCDPYLYYRLYCHHGTIPFRQSTICNSYSGCFNGSILISAFYFILKFKKNVN